MRFGAHNRRLVVDKREHLLSDALRPWTWHDTHDGRETWTHWAGDVEEALRSAGIPYRIEVTAASPDEADRVAKFEAVKRWFEDDWTRIEPKLRTSIVEGISVFLSLFDDNPQVKHTFCPPKDTYDVQPQSRRASRHAAAAARGLDRAREGHRAQLPDRDEPRPGARDRHDAEAGLSARRAQSRAEDDVAIRSASAPRAVPVRRIPGVRDDGRERAVGRREVLLAGASGEVHSDRRDPEHQLAPLDAPGRVLAHAAAGTPDEDLPDASRTTSARSMAADLCGKAERLKPGYTLTEAGQDARVSMLTGRPAAQRSTVSASKTYSLLTDYVFQPKTFAELRNAQAIVLPYDGLNPQPPTYCYLKPHYLDVQTSYFDHVEAGAL